jgi:hypothetical protein
MVQYLSSLDRHKFEFSATVQVHNIWKAVQLSMNLVVSVDSEEWANPVIRKDPKWLRGVVRLQTTVQSSQYLKEISFLQLPNIVIER